MMEITAKQIMEWVEKAKIEGISPNALLISKPDTPSIRIAGTEVYCSARPLIHTVMGIEIWIDNSIEKDKAYLIDKNTFKKLGEIDNIDAENKTQALRGV